MEKLLIVTEEEKTAILQHYNLTETEFKSLVINLKEWFKKTLDIFAEKDERIIRMVLAGAKMRPERAKEMTRGIIKLKYDYPDMTKHFSPTSDYYKKAKKYSHVAIMPNLTPSLERVTIFKYTDPDGEAEDAKLYYFFIIMCAFAVLPTDFCLTNVIILDFEQFGYKNILKHTPNILHFLKDLNAPKFRIKAVHFVNSPPILENILYVAKITLPKKIMSRIQIHTSTVELQRYIPRENLPSDYGGSHSSIHQIHDQWCEALEDEANRDYFVFNARLSRDIMKKFLNEKNEDANLGTQGTFRRLEID